jgi:gluconolactonase
MAVSSGSLTIGSAEIGPGATGSRWEPGAAPIRYPDPNIKLLHKAFEKYVLPMAAIERIAGGCRFTEGPVWFGDGRYLLWSDIPNDRILKWEEETGAVSVFRRPSEYANGNTRDRQGRLVTCEMGSQRLTRTEHDGTITVLAESFDGKRLTGPNDVVVKSDGSIWFSDNGAGIRGNYLGNKGVQELPFRVYRIDPKSGAITIVVGDMERPNGLAFSPDESRLYVVDTPGGDKTVHVYDIVDDGIRAANGRLFFNAFSTRCRAMLTASGSIPTAMSGAAFPAARARTGWRCSPRTAA